MEEEEENEEKTSTKFAQSIVEHVNRADIEAMVQVQRDMLSRYEKTNEMLINFNLLSLSRHEATSQEFKNHTQVLYDMKKDLDSVFRRIRMLKQRLSTMYPEAFSFCSDVYNMMSEEEDETTDQTKDTDKKNVKHSKDPDPTVADDGMNEMLDSHRNEIVQQDDSGCDNNGQNIQSEDDIHVISKSGYKDQLHICNSTNIKQSTSDNFNCNSQNSKQNSVVENG